MKSVIYFVITKKLFCILILTLAFTQTIIAQVDMTPQNMATDYVFSITTETAPATGIIIVEKQTDPAGLCLAVGGENSISDLNVFRFNETDLKLADAKDHGINSRSVSWSPDGNYLAVGGDNSSSDVIVYAFDGLSLTPIITYNYGNAVYSVAWSPDGNYLAVGGSNPFDGYEVKVFSFDGSSLTQITGANKDFGNAVYSVSWSPDGNYLAVGGSNPFDGYEVKVFSFDGSSLTQITGANKDFGNAVYSVSWSPDGNYLAVGGSNPFDGYEVKVFSFDGSSLTQITGANKDFGNAVYSVSWSPDGNYLAVGGDNSSSDVIVYAFDGLSLTPIITYNYGNAVYSVAWSPDGNYLAVGGSNPFDGYEVKVFSFDGSSLTQITGANKDFGNTARSVSWTPNGSTKSFEFSTSYGSNFFLADDESNNSDPLTPGTYSVSEVKIPVGWNLTGATCDDGSDPSSIELSAGETVTCTFINTEQQQTGTIIIEKQTNPDGSTKSFEFSTSYGSNFFLADDESNNSDPLTPGTYSVSEVKIPVGWNLTGATCDDGSDPSSIDLSAGETVTCTFINDEVVQFPFMTIWSVNDDIDGKLQYYTLDISSAFLNIEGEILLKDANGEPINDAKDLEDLIIDSSPPNEIFHDGKFYLVNNVGTSKIYSLDYGEFDNDPDTEVNAILVLDTGLPTNPNGSSPEEISSLLIYDSKLYGTSKRTKKLYEISTEDGSLTQVFTLDIAGDFRTDGMTFRQGGMTLGPTSGTVYLLKTNDSGGESEIWKFISFPSGNIEYVRQIETSGKVEALTAHPDGYLYASDQETLYKISVDNSDIWYLADYTVDIEGMDYFYEIENNMTVVPTRAFIPIGPTPVELVSFTAEAKSGKVVLNWKTATEVDNYGFDVERQVGSKQSAVGNWEKIGFVDGHGNSNSPKIYQLTDSSPLGGTNFSYRLKQIDNDGTYEYSNIVEVELVPTEFALHQNYPNPFNPSTKIKYSIPQETAVTIKVFDILGEEVMTLVNEKQEAGSYNVSVNGSNLGSGIYFYQMQAGEFSNTKKMLIIK